HLRGRLYRQATIATESRHMAVFLDPRPIRIRCQEWVEEATCQDELLWGVILNGERGAEEESPALAALPRAWFAVEGPVVTCQEGGCNVCTIAEYCERDVNGVVSTLGPAPMYHTLDSPSADFGLCKTHRR